MKIEPTSKRPKILHAMSLMRPSSGQLNQLDWEQQAANQLGLPWTSRAYCPASVNHKNSIIITDENSGATNDDQQKQLNKNSGLWRWIQLRKNYHAWLKKQQDEYDILMLRYYVHDPFQLHFLKTATKPVFLFSHTLEVPELKLAGGLGGCARATMESILGPLCLNSASGIVGVTSEVIDYQSSRTTRNFQFTHEYPNGILDTQRILQDKRSASVPELLFVANFLPWHGLEDLMASAASCSEEFILHVVGEVSDDARRLGKRNKRVVLHGLLPLEGILQLSESCWIGLSSMRLDKKGARQSATLKAPMYLSAGLPVYGCGDVLPEDFAYYQRGGPCMKHILKFAHAVRHCEKSSVRDKSIRLIDKRELLNNLYKKIALTF